MRRIFRRPSPATVLASLALLVAAGVPAEAARFIDGKRLKRNSVTGKQIRDRTVTMREIATSARRQLTATPDGSVGAAALADRAVSTGKLADGAVTAPKLAAGSVTGASVADGSLGPADIAPDSLGAGQLATDAVGGFEIARNAVDGDEIAEGSVDSTEIRNGSLGTPDIGSFIGTAVVDVAPVTGGACATADFPAQEISATNPPRSLLDDVIVVTAPPEWPDGLTLLAKPASATSIRLVACNPTGGLIDPPSGSFRYLSVDGP